MRDILASRLPGHLAKWVLLSLSVSALSGSASALFLVLLDAATSTRLAHPWLLLLLPACGGATGWVYKRWGGGTDRGNNLLIDEIHDPRRKVPLRMAPLVLVSTVLSHLFGASVGREGTAVQMGGSLADQISDRIGLSGSDRRILLTAGISAGFASVFGTPLAGAVFGLEVLSIGQIGYEALLACSLSAVGADRICALWGVHHTHYDAGAVPAASWAVLAAVLVAGVVFGTAGKAFSVATQRLGAFLKRLIPDDTLRPAAGGAVVALAGWFLPVQRFLGLGVPTIVESFRTPLPAWTFLGKFGFTVACLGSGFKGGEVTPLFFIGATLGNALSPLLHLPIPFLASLGFAAVFAGAANTPIASTLLAMELFGSPTGTYALLACTASYLFSGTSGIYRAQRLAKPKA